MSRNKSCFTSLGQRLLLALAVGGSLAAQEAQSAMRLATFSAEITPPLGHPLFGGKTARTIADSLFARGFVLGEESGVMVLVAVDWCEIRNDAHDRWREVLAKAAGTTPNRVMVTSVHQHDAPLADLEAERILQARGAGVQLIDLDYHERMVQKTAESLRTGLKNAVRVTHFGMGQAMVERIASNRRFVEPDGRIHFGRGSNGGGNPAYREFPDGEIDPWLRTLSFWAEDRPVAALMSYATHPMSYYGGGEVSSDFVGLARARWQRAHPDVHAVYASGCAGDVTAGKYNDGSPTSRVSLTGRLVEAMESAWVDTHRILLTQVDWRSVPLRLEARVGDGFKPEDLERKLTAPGSSPFERVKAALGLSWHNRVQAGHVLDVPVLDLGAARVVLMPGETFVGYSLQAQKLQPDLFLMMLGYGECAPGYIPTRQITGEGFNVSHDWLWVRPDAHRPMMQAVEAALQ